MSRRLRLLPLLLVFGAGCNFGVDDIPASAVPEHPSFEADVRPLLADHCTLCHGVPAKRGAPGHFRLDQYEDDEKGRSGAHAMAGSLVKTVRDDEMPPAAAWGDGLGPNGKELLDRWLEDGAPP